MLVPVRYQEEYGLLATFSFHPQPQSTTKTVTQIGSFDRELSVLHTVLRNTTHFK